MKYFIVIIIIAVFVGYNLVDDFDSKKLKGKNVIITGASTGIGEQMAYHYAEFGANLLITARSEDRLQKVVERCKAIGHKKGQYLYYVADMSDQTAIENLIKDAEERLGGIDYLLLNHIFVNDMGEWIGSRENLTTLHKIIDVNFVAYVHLASHAMRLLQASNGSIIVVSSLAGRVSQPYIAPYSASKFALEGFFSGLRQELKIKDIDVSITICFIGLVGTRNAIDILQNFGATNVFNWIRMARSEDVALAIIKGGTARARELAYPYFEVKFGSMLNTVSPWLMETVLQFIYKRL